MPQHFKIGDLAKRTHCPVVTIRYYEKEGLLPEPMRTDANYRLYTQDHLERLAFILRCRSLDMTLEEVRALLRVKDMPRSRCDEVNRLLEQHIDHVSERISELQTLQEELREIRSRCAEQTTAADCGILSELSASDPSTAKSSSRPGHVQRTHK